MVKLHSYSQLYQNCIMMTKLETVTTNIKMTMLPRFVAGKCKKMLQQKIWKMYLLLFDF